MAIRSVLSKYYHGSNAFNFKLHRIALSIGQGWLLFSNIVGANDTNMLSENYSGLVGMINKRINIVQTDYAEVAAKYLKSKGYR